MMRSLLIGGLLLAGFTWASTARGEVDPLERARQFIAEHEAVIRPLEIASGKASWQADASGKREDFAAREAAQNRLDAALSDPRRFARLEAIHQALGAQAAKADARVARQIQVLHLQYLEKQVDPALLQAMTARASAATQAFNTYRAKVDGKELTQSQVVKVLKESRDPAYRRKVWEASKGVGSVVEKDLKELVKIRNQAARKLGFANYHDMQFRINELSQAEVLKIFDQLHELTREPFARTKAQIDARLAANCGIQPQDLRPWHYHDLFFQEAPAIHGADLDALYAKADIPALCRTFFSGIGLSVDDVLKRSDLYERPGKYPHAQCSDLDGEGDVRVMANIVANEDWMGTMLHELGHAVYSTPNIPLTTPYVLRWPAHALTTEGVAMMFEQFSRRADWMEAMGLALADKQAVAQAGAKMRRDHLLIFAGWAQVMVRFEMALYDNPDQDLNTLWWDLVEKYQLIRRPENRNAPDYASKIHIISSPAYYQNYLLGELFATQLHRAIATQVLKADVKTALYNGRPEVGEFLRRKVIEPGRTMRWDQFVRFATGEELGAKAFAEAISE